jgi:taurine transport system ATP-binding protein
MDEPFGALDSMTREQMQELLVSVWARTGKQVFFITHSIEEALFLGTQVIVMSPRPGRIVARFEPEFVRTFARDQDARAIKTSPDFAYLREEIRAIVHNADNHPENQP